MIVIRIDQMEEMLSADFEKVALNPNTFAHDRFPDQFLKELSDPNVKVFLHREKVLLVYVSLKNMLLQRSP